MDLDVPGALPTMVCRPPTINGTALAVAERGAGQGDARRHRRRDHPAHAFVPGGVAVRATTFGQCIDAIQALQVQWAPGHRGPATPTPTCSADWSAPSSPMTPGAAGRTLDSASPSTSATQPAGDQLRRRRRPSGQRRDLGPDQVADRRPGARSPRSSDCPCRASRPRDPGRRVVRPPPVLRRGVRGGGDLARRSASRSS